MALSCCDSETRKSIKLVKFMKLSFLLFVGHLKLKCQLQVLKIYLQGPGCQFTGPLKMGPVAAEQYAGDTGYQGDGCQSQCLEASRHPDDCTLEFVKQVCGLWKLSQSQPE
jgi:hypothetical protein